MIENQNCIICDNNCDDCKILLNGTLYHPSCLEKIYKNNRSISNDNFSIEDQIRKLRKQADDAKSLFGKFKNIFTKDKIDIKQVMREVHTLSRKLLQNIDALEYNQKILYDIYSFWPTYPPDWEERKREVRERSDKCCENCGTKYAEKHIHHDVPISSGGNHLLSNLEYLCIDCHSRKHRGRVLSTPDIDFDSNKKSPFQKKLDILYEAKNKNKIVSFSYKKYEGDRSVRAISPEGFKQVGKSFCVYGRCYLRNQNRTFAINRMTRLKISDAPEDCFDK